MTTRSHIDHGSPTAFFLGLKLLLKYFFEIIEGGRETAIDNFDLLESAFVSLIRCGGKLHNTLERHNLI